MISGLPIMWIFSGVNITDINQEQRIKVYI